MWIGTMIWDCTGLFRKMVCNIYKKKNDSAAHFSATMAFLTDAEEDLVDVNGGEVQEEEGEVHDEKEEAQNDTHPLLEPLT